MKKIIFWIALVFVAIQFIPVDTENRPVSKKNNFADLYKTPDHIRVILQNACYDCHSNQTKYPEYAYIAPISWAIKDHVNQGRGHLNFSEWGLYNKELKENAVEKIIGTIKSGEMPMPSYIGYHPEANLTTQQRKELVDYFQNKNIK